MKTTQFVLLSVLFSFVALGFHTAAYGDDDLKTLYEKAKKEGEVVLAAGSPPEAMKAQINGFMKRFPGIKVDHIPSSGADAASKILVETKVGMATYEVAQATSTSAQKMLEADLLARYDYSLFGVPKKEIRFGDRLVPWFDLTWALGFNTKLVAKDQVPTSWEGLLDPKWKGRKIVVVGRGYPFGDLTPAWGLEKVLEYTRKFKAQDPILLPRGGPQTLEALVSGQAPLAIIQFDRVLKARDKFKAPVDYVWLSPDPVTRFFSFAVKKVRHPNAAKLLAGYLGTPEASLLMEQASFRSQLGPNAKTKAAELMRQAGVELIWNAPTMKEAKELNEWRKQTRKILTGH
jgi:iron(III) transport system substrate-binding protein